ERSARLVRATTAAQRLERGGAARRDRTRLVLAPRGPDGSNVAARREDAYRGSRRSRHDVSAGSWHHHGGAPARAPTALMDRVDSRARANGAIGARLPTRSTALALATTPPAEGRRAGRQRQSS